MKTVDSGILVVATMIDRKLWSSRKRKKVKRLGSEKKVKFLCSAELRRGLVTEQSEYGIKKYSQISDWWILY